VSLYVPIHIYIPQKVLLGPKNRVYIVDIPIDKIFNKSLTIARSHRCFFEKEE